eukprot:TRINITY_DN5566_c0_g1_i3.p1 TRINITY_DN5566_c0_g1~~TRINITY_DN5566_c0_g1_i3.p1  ORF type:complete len:557 (-),score=115.33 TRINITY_DN5566_c0_g1_i3:124-1794(-)
MSKSPVVPPKRVPSRLNLERQIEVDELKRQVERLTKNLTEEREAVQMYMNQKKRDSMPLASPVPESIGELMTDYTELLLALNTKENTLQTIMKMYLESQKSNEALVALLKTTVTEAAKEKLDDNNKLQYQFSTLRIEAAEAQMKQVMAEKELAIVKEWFDELNEQVKVATQRAIELEVKEKVQARPVVSIEEDEGSTMELTCLKEAICEVKRLRQVEKDLKSQLEGKHREFSYFERKIVLMSSELELQKKEIAVYKDLVESCTCDCSKDSVLEELEREKEEQKKTYSEEISRHRTPSPVGSPEGERPKLDRKRSLSRSRILQFATNRSTSKRRSHGESNSTISKHFYHDRKNESISEAETTPRGRKPSSLKQERHSENPSPRNHSKHSERKKKDLEHSVAEYSPREPLKRPKISALPLKDLSSPPPGASALSNSEASCTPRGTKFTPRAPPKPAYLLSSNGSSHSYTSERSTLHGSDHGSGRTTIHGSDHGSHRRHPNETSPSESRSPRGSVSLKVEPSPRKHSKSKAPDSARKRTTTNETLYETKPQCLSASDDK